MGGDVAHRIRVLARRSSDHLAVRLLIVLTSPHSYRSPVDRVTGLLAPAPAKRAIAKRFRALVQNRLSFRDLRADAPKGGIGASSLGAENRRQIQDNPSASYSQAPQPSQSAGGIRIPEFHMSRLQCVLGPRGCEP